MKLLNLKLENFLSYKKQELKLEDGITLFLGKNGSGKSSIIEGILWVLFGESRAGSDADLVKIGQKKMKVELEFECNGFCYRIIREKKSLKASNTLQLSQTEDFLGKDTDITESTIKETQAKIQEIIKLDYKSFLVSVYFGQDKTGVFSESTPTERKAVLRKILDLTWIDNCLKKVTNEDKDIELEISRLDAVYQTLKNSLLEEDVLRDSLITINCNIETREAVAKKYLDKYNDLVALYNNKKADVDKVESQYAHFKDIQKMLDSLKSEQIEIGKKQESYKLTITDNKTKSEKELENLRLVVEQEETTSKLLTEKMIAVEQFKQSLVTDEDAYNSINKEVIIIQTESSSLRKRFAELKDLDVCYVCDADLTGDKKKELLDKLTLQGNELRDKETKLIEGLNTAKTSMATKKEAFELLNKELADIDKKVQDLTWSAKMKAQNIENYDKQIVLYEKFYKEAEDRFIVVLVDIKKYTDSFNSFEAIDENGIKVLKEKLNDIEIERNREANNYANENECLQKDKEEKRLIEYKLEQIEKSKVEMQSMQDKIAELQKKTQVNSILKELFGKNGISVLLMDNSLRTLETLSNKYLDELSDNNLSVAIETKKELQSGDEKDSLEIVISDTQGKRSYEMYSGGEKMRINIALRLALSDLLCNRYRSKIEFLAVDEGFVSLDDVGLDSFCELINKINSKFKQIFLISHMKEVKEFFGNYKLVEKKNDESIIR